MTGPAPCVGMRPHRLHDGKQMLVGFAHREFTVPVGAELILRRVDDDERGPLYRLLVVPGGEVSPAARARIAADNQAGSADRDDPRDAGAVEPARQQGLPGIAAVPASNDTGAEPRPRGGRNR